MKNLILFLNEKVILKSYRVPEQPPVELKLKILFQKAGVSSRVASQLLQDHEDKR